ncbi:R3H domain-containing nucleic acid-binding protein [Synechococcus elongatus]|uniref:R3H domain-containing nucleic acid-binding protein n=1 Tax=Synechococcus elongatus TaxID=32046 RepID=UPI000F7F1CE5|nr:R3H domain-containing nucleic acid-binding protein [Synechococcus elongatus]
MSETLASETLTPELAAVREKTVVDNLDELLEILPPQLRDQLLRHPQKDRLVEVVLDLGRFPEARFPEGAEYLSETPVSREDLAYCAARVGDFGADNRAGIERTLHRISAIRNRKGEVIGLTCRVGRAVFGTVGMIRDLVETGQSLLFLGRPGVGKTTALREVARVLADDLLKRVVIIDTSNEIAGDGDIPHPAIGRARRLQVARPELQHQVMIEAVENHMPEVIIIDEIGTELEALAARTIAERGVQLVGTAHGNQIENLIKNPTLSDLVGGIQSVTLGDDEARRRGSQKTVLERKAPPTFEIAVEMLERYRWVVHEDVANTVDLLLRQGQPNPQVRTLSDDGRVLIAPAFKDAPKQPASVTQQTWSHTSDRGWRSSGRMRPLPPVLDVPTTREDLRDPEVAFEQALATDVARPVGPNGEELPLHVYPYAVSRHYLEQVIDTLQLPVLLTKDLADADVVLALRGNLKGQSKLRHVARNHHVPIHVIKSNTMPQIVRALRRLLNQEQLDEPETVNLELFTKAGKNDEIEALEEARLAVEQIVLPKGQPVELLPRSAIVRKMQHELVEHYRLKSASFGEEPNRRLRIFPA